MGDHQARKRSLGPMAALALAGLACGFGAGGNTPAPAGAMVGSATSTPAPQAAAATANCDNQYVPIVEGATATWKVTTSSGAVTNPTAMTKDVGPDGFSIVRSGKRSNGAAYTLVEKWSCKPEGLIQFPTGDLAEIATGKQGTVTASSMSNQGVTLPREIKAGDTWTETFNGDLTGLDGSKTNWTTAYAFKAEGDESVTVPAGSFTAMKISNTITWPNMGVPEMHMDYWFAPGIGMVKYVFSMSGAPLATGELVSRTVP